MVSTFKYDPNSLTPPLKQLPKHDTTITTSEISQSKWLSLGLGVVNVANEETK